MTDPTPHPGDVLAWIDVETTGLDARTDYLLEVACILTDTDFNELAEPFHRVVGYSVPLINRMFKQTREFVQKMHLKTGLWDKLPTGTPLAVVDQELREYISAVAPKERQARVAGNSVRLDLNFLEAQLPETYSRLHYRFVDVTGLEFLLSAQGFVDAVGSADRDHDALSDIRASIEQARAIRDQLHTAGLFRGAN